MAMEIDKTILRASIAALESNGLFADNLKEVLAESDQYDIVKIPHKIILTDDGYLSTKIIKEKVVLQ
jgi:hypothetical protein